MQKSQKFLKFGIVLASVGTLPRVPERLENEPRTSISRSDEFPSDPSVEDETSLFLESTIFKALSNLGIVTRSSSPAPTGTVCGGNTCA